MTTITKEATSKTPYVSFDANKGLIEIKGRVIPENCDLLFQPLLDWLDQYKANPHEQTTVNFGLDYFNTSSAKYILDIFKKIEQLYKDGNKVIVTWTCENGDIDMIEAGEDYQLMVQVPMRIIEKAELN